MLSASPLAAETAAVVVFSTDEETLELSPDDFESVHSTFANNEPGISFILDGAAGDAFGDLTERSIGKILQMAVCGEVLIEATVQERLSGRGTAIVDGLGTATWYAERMSGDAPCP